MIRTIKYCFHFLCYRMGERPGAADPSFCGDSAGRFHWGLANGRLERQEKAIDGALVPWPAGLGLPKRHLDGLRAGKRHVWTTRKSYWSAGLGLPKRHLEGLRAGKRQAWMPRKKYWCGLGALACGVGAAKKAFGGFEGWQTAGLNARNSYWWGLGALACGAFGGFEGWQTAGLNAKKKLLMGCQKGIWRVWGLANGRLERQEKAIDGALVPWPAGLGLPKKHLGFGAFEGWQTAGLNAKKKLLIAGLGLPKRRLEGLEGLTERAKFHTSGGPRRRPCLGKGRGRRIILFISNQSPMTWPRTTCSGSPRGPPVSPHGSCGFTVAVGSMAPRPPAARHGFLKNAGECGYV